MDGPKTVIAHWRTDYTQLYALLAGVVIIAAAIILLKDIKRNDYLHETMEIVEADGDKDALRKNCMRLALSVKL